jgi:hypothetical protein
LSPGLSGYSDTTLADKQRYERPDGLLRGVPLGEVPFGDEVLPSVGG